MNGKTRRNKTDKSNYILKRYCRRPIGFWVMPLALSLCVGWGGCQEYQDENSVGQSLSLEDRAYFEGAASTDADDREYLPQEALHFPGTIALTSQKFEMRVGSPNHPGTLKAGVVRGLELFGAQATGISGFSSSSYGLSGTWIELDLSTGMLAQKVNAYPEPYEETLNPPDEGGNAAAYAGLLGELLTIVETVAAGNDSPYLAAEPAPELDSAILYIETLLTSVSGGATVGTMVDGTCYPYCPNGFTDDPDYDGWGWADEGSCVVGNYLRDSDIPCFAPVEEDGGMPPMAE